MKITVSLHVILDIKPIFFKSNVSDPQEYPNVFPMLILMLINPFTGNSAIWRSAILRIINKNLFSQML